MLSVFPGRMGDLEIELQLSVCIMSSCQYCIVRIDSTFYIWYVIWYTTHPIYDLEWCHGSYQAILYHLFLLWNRSLSEAVSIGNLPYISKASRHTIKSILSKKHCQWGPGNAMNSSHKHRLAVSSITPHWPARTSGAACGFHRKKGQVLQKLRAHWQVHDHHEEFLLHIMAWCLHDSSDFEVNEKKIKMGASPFCRILVLCSSLPFWIKNKSIHHSWRLKQKRSLKIHPISPRLPKKRSHQTPYFVVAIPSILFSRNQVTPLDFHHYNIPKTNVVSLDLRFSRWFPQGFEHGWKIQNQNIGKTWTGNIWSTLFFSVKKCILTNISYIYLQQDSQPNLCTDMSGTLSCDASPKKSEEVTTLGTHHKFMTKVADNIRIFQPGRFSNSNKESTLVGPQQKLPKLWMGIRSWTYYEQFNLHPIWDP